ncbi:MAG TPA: hypothetical protein VK745_12400 [Polyangiaceae bacterium]|nr:hypothetical protein [Polyangiaceae bacterium]
MTPDIQYFEVTASHLDDAAEFTDLSALNPEPAGSHGFVRAELGHFVDDRRTRLRFFGVNLTGVACFPEHAVADRLARHFRRLGFNAVRLLALDVDHGILADNAELATNALDRLDYFTAALKAQGLSFTLTLHSASGYPGLEGDARARFPQGKVLDRFHRPFLDAQRDFARRLLGHENAYTHTAYNAEPALLYVELSNEDSIFPSWAGSPDDAPASYRAELAHDYAPWLAERTAEGFRAPGPAAEEAKGELPTFQSSLSERTDYAEFLRATELGTVKALASFVRDELKLHSMLINTQASFGGLAGVLREAELSDFIDVHGYWDHPRLDDGAKEPRWTVQNTPQVTASDGGTLGVMASYRVFGKPFSVSEYASAAPNEYAAEMFPLLIGVAGLQDWDALFAFAYTDQKQDYEPARINGIFDLAGHPIKLAFVTTAASSFRRGLVAPATSRVELLVPKTPTALPFSENALPALWTANGVPQTAVALRQVGITLRDGSGPVSASYALHVSGALGSDTGELFWESDGQHPRFSVDAQSLKLVCGQLAQSALKFGDIGLEFADFSGGFACVSLLALDDLPVAKSRRLLFTVAGRANNAHHPESTDKTTVGPFGDGPVLAQFVPVTLSLPRDAWHAEALGAITHPVPVTTTTDSKLSTVLQGATLSYAITR